MTFNSAQFLIFFPIITAIYFTLPYRYRWLLLLIASCYFYIAFIPIYILILFFIIIIDYTAGIKIESVQGKTRRLFLILSIIANVGVLAIFKYFNFFNVNIAALARLLDWHYPVQNLSLLLPIGLSFHTFQSLGYTIEVYRGHQKAEKHLGVFALYVMFYPQLVAGPIERSMQLLPQFHQNHAFNYQEVTSGLKLMVWGFFKKIVIADRLAVIVDAAYNRPTEFSGLLLLTATYFFAFQIYCDFSGYSDIAIGAAQVMGYHLTPNFKRPYFSKSISEFWQRWHISLSTWFRDYLYIPLGGNRVVKWRWYYNLMITFLISGLWHGASWTFIVWGALHGFYMLCSFWTTGIQIRITQALRLDQHPILEKSIKTFVTFHLVTFAWIFFRANSISDAIYIINNLSFVVFSQSIARFSYEIIHIFGKVEFAYCFIFIIILEWVELFQRSNTVMQFIAGKPIWLRWIIYYAAILSILMFGKHDVSQFIYFQF